MDLVEKDALFTITDVARMVLLSDRTIRTHIRDGRLSGRKINGKWFFTREELGRFFDDAYVGQGIRIKNNALVQDFIIRTKKAAAAVCAIYDIPVESEPAAANIQSAASSLMNSGRFQSMTMIYHYEIKNKTVRLILTGKPGEVAEFIRRCEPGL